MARGWESKSVEDQIQLREATAENASREVLTPEEMQRRGKRDAILAVRGRTLTALQTACDSRRRAHFEAVLADLDEQLRFLG